MQEVDQSSHLAYREYPDVTIFPYITNGDGLTFIFFRDNETKKLSAIRGVTESCDSSIVMTSARAILRASLGLFTSENISKENKELQPLLVKKPQHFSCNLIFNEPSFIRLLSYFNNNATQYDTIENCRVYALPFKYFSLDSFNAFLKLQGSPNELCLIELEKLGDLSSESFEKPTYEMVQALREGLVPRIQKKIPLKPSRRFAILSCREINQTEPEADRMFNFSESCQHGHFRRTDEEWRIFKIRYGEYPDPSLVQALDGVIVPGSPGHCYDPANAKWIVPMEEFIRYLKDNTRVRYLGLCYGAQLLAQALGGKVEKMSDTLRKGNDEVFLNDEFYNQPYVKAYKELYERKPKTLSYVKVHQDHITELPKEAKLLASSNTTEVEIFCVGERFLATQGHPESTSDFTCSLASSVKLSEADDEAIEAFEKQKAQTISERYSIKESKFEFLTILSNFLKNTY